MRFSKREKRRYFLVGVGALLVVAVIAIVTVLALRPGAEPKKEASSGPAVPNDMLRVDDIYEGSRLVPKFDFPVSEYDAAKFQSKNGMIHYSVGKTTAGVDVSEFQGTVDWAKVKAAGIDFAILRVGYRGLTEGLLNEDSSFEQNYEAAKAAGLKIGAYFFSQAVTEKEAEEEADFALKVLNGRPLDYPLVFDWEQPMVTEELTAEKLRADECTGAEVAAFTAAFCKRVEKGNYRPAFYGNKTFCYDFLDMTPLKAYDFWYAEYGVNAPSLYYDFRMWQYTDSGSLPGIEGAVDLNICFEPY